MKPQIIGVSGVTGAGKSTLAAALAKEFDATLICWDDFDSISKGPEDYVNWFNCGQDYSEWNYSELANVLELLQSKHSCIHPVQNQQLASTDLIFFDAPLGRLHHQTGQFIDVLIHIEVLLDVSLSRRLIRDFKTSETNDALLKELEFYLNVSRPLYFNDKLKDGADLILDGLLPTQIQVQSIMKFLSSLRCPQRGNQKNNVS